MEAEAAQPVNTETTVKEIKTAFMHYPENKAQSSLRFSIKLFVSYVWHYLLVRTLKHPKETFVQLKWLLEANIAINIHSCTAQGCTMTRVLVLHVIQS